MEQAMETLVTHSVYAADSEARYDALCKRLLSEKWILGWIMKSCLEEYRDCTPREIVERYIEGTPQVGEEPVFADDAPRIHGMGNEDASRGRERSCTTSGSRLWPRLPANRSA